MDLAKLKLILSTFGITSLDVHFDIENKQIVADYNMRGVAQHKAVKFETIEKGLTQGVNEARTAPPGEKQAPAGT